MKKSELKKMLKPLIREAVKEVILEEGMISTVIAEAVRGSVMAQQTQGGFAQPTQHNAMSAFAAQAQAATGQKKSMALMGEHKKRQGFNEPPDLGDYDYTAPEPQAPQEAPKNVFSQMVSEGASGGSYDIPKGATGNYVDPFSQAAAAGELGPSGTGVDINPLGDLIVGRGGVDYWKALAFRGTDDAMKLAEKKAVMI